MCALHNIHWKIIDLCVFVHFYRKGFASILMQIITFDVQKFILLQTQS